MNKFGKWTATGEPVGRKTPCRCECGTARLVVTYDLTHDKSTNCGCVRKVAMPNAAKIACTTHGRSNKTEQWIWSDMKRRCYNQVRRGYRNYGGRGITVCDRWLVGDGAKTGLGCFIEDMGPRPSNDYTLDRKDNDLSYSPNNCRWAAREDQDYNKRNTFKFTAFGEEFTLKSAEARFGINTGALYQRLTTGGMAPEDAVTMPRKKN